MTPNALTCEFKRRLKSAKTCEKLRCPDLRRFVPQQRKPPLRPPHPFPNTRNNRAEHRKPDFAYYWRRKCLHNFSLIPHEFFCAIGRPRITHFHNSSLGLRRSPNPIHARVHKYPTHYFLVAFGQHSTLPFLCYLSCCCFFRWGDVCEYSINVLGISRLSLIAPSIY